MASASPSISPSYSPSLSPSASPSLSPSYSPSVSPSPADLIYPPTQNGLQKTLGASLDAGVTASATLSNTTGIQNKKGLFVVDRIDTNGAEKSASLREYISFAGVSGSTVTTLTRGLGGTSDQAHANGAVVEFVMDVVQQQAVIDTLLVGHGTDGTHKANILASEMKASGANIDTGTSDVLFATPKGIADSKLSYTDGTETLTNKTMDYNSNTFQNFPSADWTTDTDTWTYVSATSFKISGKDVSSRFPIGTKIKLTQTTAKYFYVRAVAYSTDTTVTVFAGSDYSLANAAITSPSYSYAEQPQGFPEEGFTWTPGAYAASESMTWTSVSGYFWLKLSGALATIYGNVYGTTGGTASAELYFDLPFAVTNAHYGGSSGGVGRNGGGYNIPTHFYMFDTNTIAICKYDKSNWILSVTTGSDFCISYQIN